MKKFRSLFAVVLVIAMLLSLTVITSNAATVQVATYNELINAINDATDGTTIQLTANILIEDIIVIDEGSFTIDLNGHNLYTDDTTSYTVTNYEPEEGSIPEEAYNAYNEWTMPNLSLVIEGANVTIIDEIGTGMLDFQNKKGICVFDGTLTLNKITVNASSTNITCFGGTLNLNEVYSNKGAVFAMVDGIATVNAKNCTFEDDDFRSIFEIFNGTSNINNCTFEEVNSAFTTYGGTLNIYGGTYSSLFNIFDAMGGTINIDGDAEFSSIWYHTFYTDSDYSELDITINSGTFYAYGSTFLCYGGNITINDGNFRNATLEELDVPSDAETCIVINNRFNEFGENNKFTINGGTFTATNTDLIAIGNSFDEYEPMELVINGGTLTSNSYYTILAEDGGENNDLTINGGTFINNAHFGTCLRIYEATATINGGEFTAKYGDGIAFVSGKIDINDCIATGGVCGLNIALDGISEITLNGGQYFSTIDSLKVADFDDNQNTYDYVKTIASGIYSYNPDSTLTSYLGSDDICYFSKSGIDKITVVDEMSQKTEKAVVIEKKTAAITDGANAKLSEGLAKDTLFTSDYNFTWFDSVKVDGKTVDPSNYTAVEGSTKVTLKASYLNTLKEGKHTLEVVSNVLGNEVVAKTTFTVTVAPVEEEKIADTSDNNMLGFYVALCTISSVAVTTMIKKKEE